MNKSDNIIEAIETIIKNDISDENIKLKNWQKLVIKLIYDDGCKRVWIFKKCRKVGATSLCKWVHWFNADSKMKTSIISDNLNMAKSIYRMPIEIKNLIKGDNNLLGKDSFEAISGTHISMDGNHNDIMYDAKKFDVIKYKLIDSVEDRALVTFCLPYEYLDYIKGNGFLKPGDAIVLADEPILPE